MIGAFSFHELRSCCRIEPGIKEKDEVLGLDYLFFGFCNGCTKSGAVADRATTGELSFI